MRLNKIAQSWYNFIQGSDETKHLMASRLAICDICPNKAEMNSFGKIIVTAINSNASTYYCAACNCPLAAKTANKGNACPIGRWKPVP